MLADGIRQRHSDTDVNFIIDSSSAVMEESHCNLEKNQTQTSCNS